MMSSFSDTLEEALRRAFAVQDPDALRRSVRILEEGYDPVRRLEGDVGIVKQDTTEIKSDVSILKSDVGVLKTDVSVLKGDVGVLKTDVSVLKGDVGVLKTDVSVLQGDVTVLKSDVRLIAERMEQGFARMDERFEAMERLNMARFDAVDKRFEAVDQRFLSMESANAARFEQVDRRFAQQNRMMFAGLTVLAVLMSIYEFVG